MPASNDDLGPPALSTPRPCPTIEARWTHVLAAIALVVVCGPPTALAQECIYTGLATEGSEKVVVHDAAGRRSTRIVESGVEVAAGLIVAQDGSRLFVADSARSVVVELGSSGIVTRFPVGREPGQLAMSADGHFLFVANRGDETISVVDLSNAGDNAEVSGCSAPSDVAVEPDGARLFVACAGSNSVAVVNFSTWEVAETIPLGEGRFPESLAFHPNGRDLYVGSFGTDVDGGVVHIVDTEAALVRAEIPVGGGARGIAFSPDGRRAYVADARVTVSPRNLTLASETVGVIDTATEQLIGLIAVGEFGDGPTEIVVVANGSRAFVGTVGAVRAGASPHGALVEVDLETEAAVASMPLVGVPLSIALGAGPCPPPHPGGSPTDAQLVENILALARARFDDGKMEKALALYRRAVAIDRRSGNADRRHATLLMLAAALWDQRDFAGAGASYDELLRELESQVTPDRSQIAAVLAAAGLLDLATGNLVASREKLARSHSLFREVFGAGHVYTALAVNNLAVWEIAQRRFDLADRDMDQMVEVLRASLGTTHPYVADVLTTLALRHQVRGDANRAVPLLAEALDIRRRNVEADDLVISQSMSNLAIAYLALGDTTRAEPLLNGSFDILVKRLGPDAPQVQMAKGNLAALLAHKAGAPSGHQYLRPRSTPAATDGSRTHRWGLRSCLAI